MSVHLEPAHIPVLYTTLVQSVVRSIAIQFLYDNPLVWNYTSGKRNKQADVEGPFYILGSPSREIEKGKAVMAPSVLLENSRPFLMIIRVVTPEGHPIAGAEVDWWQADKTGVYYFRDYTLRGRVNTDEDGYAEVLTVAPGAYGVAGVMRAAHFHLWIHAPPAQPGQKAFDDMTTQIYICEGNDRGLMQQDFVNYMRKSRPGNMVECWSLPNKDIDKGRYYKDFPELSSNDVRTKKRIGWWDSKLDQMGGSKRGLKIVAGATAELHLNLKGERY